MVRERAFVGFRNELLTILSAICVRAMGLVGGFKYNSGGEAEKESCTAQSAG